MPRIPGAENDQTPAVIFFGNNVAGGEEMVAALERERVLLGSRVPPVFREKAASAT